MHRDGDRQAGRSERARTSARGRVAAAWLGALLALSQLACSGSEIARPDLVLITLGDVPVEALACHGGAEDVGRDLCSVGDYGSRFVWAFAASGAPEPAMATLLTGLPPESHGVDASAASFLRNDGETLAEHAQRAGYASAAFVTNPALNRSRHFDQGFDRFDDGGAPRPSSVEPSSPPPLDPSGPASTTAHRAAQWLAVAPSPFLAWVHLGEAEPASGAAPPSSAERLARVDRELARLIAVLDARADPPAILVTGLPARDAALDLEPVGTRVPMLWRPPRVGSGRGVSRVIRTPVSQIDVAPTLLRAIGLVDAAETLPGRPLPFRERRAGEAGRTLEIEGEARRALVGEGVYVVLDETGDALGVAQLPLAGERAPALGPAHASSELLSRIWAAPDPDEPDPNDP